MFDEFEALLDAQTGLDVEAIRLGKSSAARLLLTAPDSPAPKSEKQSLRLQASRAEPRLVVAMTPKDVATLANRHSRLRETERLLHVRAAHRIAENLADGVDAGPLPDERPSNEWIDRWRDGVAEVDGAELQQLWARLLVGEVSKPGSVSRKTLDTLRQLSADDARLFERLGPYVVDDTVIIRAEPYLGSFGYNDGTALHLQDLGLLSGAEHGLVSSSWIVSATEHGQAAVIRSHSTMLLLGVREGVSELSLPAIRLTAAGSQLLRLGMFTGDEGYLRAVAEFSKQPRYIPHSLGTTWAVIVRGRGLANRCESIQEEVVFGLSDSDGAPVTAGPSGAPLRPQERGRRCF